MCSTALNRLESLSNELLLDTFEYLDAYDLCQAFYGLNYRINTLLQSAHLHMLYDSVKENKTVWDTLTSFFNPSQIRILSVSDDINVDERFLSSCNKNLRSIRLLEVSREYIEKICQYIPNVNQLKCLDIKEKWRNYVPSDHSLVDLLLVDHSHRFISLVNLSLSSVYPINTFPIVPGTYLHLRRLSISNCYWVPDLLQFFQDNAPNLRSIKCPGYAYSVHSTLKFAIKHVHELHIQAGDTLSNLQHIVSHFPCLRRLHIDWTYNRRYPVNNGSQFQQLIESYLPHLRQLTMTFDRGIDEDILKTFHTGEFWSTKKVKAKMAVNKTHSRYRLIKTIYFGKEWHFGYFDNM